MKTNAETGKPQPSRYRAACYPSRRLCVSWLATLLLATSGTVMAATVQVQVGGNGPNFTPSSVTIQPGDTVQWNWAFTPNGASVTSGLSGQFNGLFDSGIRSAPYSFSYTFASAGSFDYFCRVLPDMMTGVVEVVGSVLANISTRLRVETGDDILIGGFIVTGAQDKKVIIRAIGPSLSLAGKLGNPTLQLFSGQTLLASNDDWENSTPADRQAIIDSGIPPTNDLESAIVRTLPANGAGYTAVVRGVNNTTGIAVVEVYDLDRSVNSKLANISTRGLVQTGDTVLFAGTIVLGQAPQKVIVRAIGPSLSIAGKMSNPTLQLLNQQGTQLAFNDDWRTGGQEAEIIASTVPPPHDLESAIVFDLPANGANYTAIVRGAGNTTGIAVVEVYALN